MGEIGETYKSVLEHVLAKGADHVQRENSRLECLRQPYNNLCRRVIGKRTISRLFLPISRVFWNRFTFGYKIGHLCILHQQLLRRSPAFWTGQIALQLNARQMRNLTRR